MQRPHLVPNDMTGSMPMYPNGQLMFGNLSSSMPSMPSMPQLNQLQHKDFTNMQERRESDNGFDDDLEDASTPLRHGLRHHSPPILRIRGEQQSPFTTMFPAQPNDPNQHQPAGGMLQLPEEDDVWQAWQQS